MAHLRQGCPIGIPKNRGGGGSSRKKFQSTMGSGEGVIAEPSKIKSVDSSKKHFFVRRLKQVIKIRRKCTFR